MDLSFKKHNNNQSKLIVSFGGLHRNMGGIPMFEFTNSLSAMNIRSDIMFLKDVSKQRYLGELPGIGINIQHTIAFLKSEIKKYKSVTFMGVSAGGYASILFGSLLKIKSVIAWGPQTDLEYAKNICIESDNHPICKLESTLGQVYKEYSNLKKHINSSTNYYLYNYCEEEDFLNSSYHFENLIQYKTVNRIDSHVRELVANKQLEEFLIKRI